MVFIWHYRCVVHIVGILLELSNNDSFVQARLLSLIRLSFFALTVSAIAAAAVVATVNAWQMECGGSCGGGGGGVPSVHAVHTLDH